ncbi:MAG: hypothetical protein ABII88_09515 [Candidatus Omnitrophota bacterium]
MRRLYLRVIGCVLVQLFLTMNIALAGEISFLSDREQPSTLSPEISINAQLLQQVFSQLAAKKLSDDEYEATIAQMQHQNAPRLTGISRRLNNRRGKRPSQDHLIMLERREHRHQRAMLAQEWDPAEDLEDVDPEIAESLGYFTAVGILSNPGITETIDNFTVRELVFLLTDSVHAYFPVSVREVREALRAKGDKGRIFGFERHLARALGLKSPVRSRRRDFRNDQKQNLIARSL